jgi:hypothetical protein
MNRVEKVNKYKVGDIVFTKANADLKLKVRRYLDRIYYCTVVEDPKEEEQVHFERELSS